MQTATAIRVLVETALAQRVPAALTLKIKQVPELFSTGVAEVDAMLGGGIPRNSITEVSGATSTGKSSFALSLLANVTQLGNACAWVDVSDTLSPESAAAAGVDAAVRRGTDEAFQRALAGRVDRPAEEVAKGAQRPKTGRRFLPQRMEGPVMTCNTVMKRCRREVLCLRA